MVVEPCCPVKDRLDNFGMTIIQSAVGVMRIASRSTIPSIVCRRPLRGPHLQRPHCGRHQAAACKRRTGGRRVRRVSGDALTSPAARQGGGQRQGGNRCAPTPPPPPPPSQGAYSAFHRNEAVQETNCSARIADSHDAIAAHCMLQTARHKSRMDPGIILLAKGVIALLQSKRRPAAAYPPPIEGRAPTAVNALFSGLDDQQWEKFMTHLQVRPSPTAAPRCCSRACTASRCLEFSMLLCGHCISMVRA